MFTERIYLRENDDKVFLDAIIAQHAEGMKRKAILVIPGGAYQNVCAGHEGEPIGVAFMPYGYNAFILHYSVARVRSFPAQLIEASLAVKHIKDNAERYGIDPDEVFVTGFSAGGHLACSLGVLWHLPEIYEATGMPYGYNRVRGMMLGYPVITNEGPSHMGTHCNLWCTDEPSAEQLAISSLEKHVDERSAPLFLVHTSNDAVVSVHNAFSLGEAYAAAGIPFEMHIYPKGPHGMALGNKITARGLSECVDEALAKWVEQAAYWAEHL